MAPLDAPPPVSRATREDIRDLLHRTKCFIFDCDGVIWRGESLLPGIAETLTFLRKQGKRLFFVTNNSTKSRAGFLQKFRDLGLDVPPVEIYSSSYAAAAYLESIDFPKDKKIYVIGEQGIVDELELKGFQHLGGPADVGKAIEWNAGTRLDQDRQVGAVVVGFDRGFSYYKLQMATLCLLGNPGCLFIATNMDATKHLTAAQEWAGAGSMVGSLKGSTKREPTVAGKPSGFILADIAEKQGLDRDEICMVGDRLDTDILFGQRGGLSTLLVLSGVTTEEQLLGPENRIYPQLYLDSLASVLHLAS